MWHFIRASPSLSADLPMSALTSKATLPSLKIKHVSLYSQRLSDAIRNVLVFLVAISYAIYFKRKKGLQQLTDLILIAFAATFFSTRVKILAYSFLPFSVTRNGVGSTDGCERTSTQSVVGQKKKKKVTKRRTRCKTRWISDVTH